ncbi:UNVERIFIED_CONTAM: hypothetical protein FKN15_004057 [Acipenser sinensis]
MIQCSSLWLEFQYSLQMPLHKFPPRVWEALKMKQGIYTQLPGHYLRSLQESHPPAAVHWKPLGVNSHVNPKTGHRERVQDVPIPAYYPPESQSCMWGGEGWIVGYRYANNDKTPQEDLNSKLGMDLKWAMLLRLACKDTELYPENPAKRETVFNKYKEFVMPVEEWVGLSLEEAVEKQRLLEKKDPEPLFKGFMEDLVQEQATGKLSEPEIVEKKS